MKFLRDFFNQEVDAWARIGVGHFVGAWAILMVVPTLIFAKGYISEFFGTDINDRIVLGILLLMCGLITYWLFRTAYRLIKNK